VEVAELELSEVAAALPEDQPSDEDSASGDLNKRVDFFLCHFFVDLLVFN
jgi:hypothetical protein